MFIKNQKWILFLLTLLLYSCAENKPIKIGVLFSLSGSMASSETPLKDLLVMCSNEVNQSGGLLNRNLELVIRDTQSDPVLAKKLAEELIVNHEVDAIFGCWTSSCRVAVKPVVEKMNSILFYPLQYEGLELSPNIIYLGSTPNQQIIPGTRWAINRFGQRVLLVGSNYLFPKITNVIIRDIVKSFAGSIEGEYYFSMEETDFKDVVTRIKACKPDVIFNTLNGQANIHFFKELKKAGITAKDIPVVSFSITENEIHDIGRSNILGHFAVWSYVDTINNASNKQFLKLWKNYMAKDIPVTDPLVSTYNGFNLWIKAVRNLQTTNISKVLEEISFSTINSPFGVLSIDRESNHSWKKVFIGQVREDGRFNIVWQSINAVEPVPFPTYRTKSDWLKIKKGVDQ